MENNSKKYVSLSKLQTFLENLSNKFAALSHKHTMSDISDYTVDTALSPTSTNPVQNKVLNEEFDAISQGMGSLELAIDGKSDSTHNHDDAYYTKSQVDTKLSSKSDSVHNHDSAYDAIGSADTALDSAKIYSNANLSTAKSYADTGDTTTLSSAKTYTDNSVAQKSQVQIIIWEDDD